MPERADHGLRERIAAVLYELDHPGESIDEASDGDKDLYRRNADAVIRELKAVTDWEAAE